MKIALYFHHTRSFGIYFKNKPMLSYLTDIANRLNLDLQVVKTEVV